MKMLFTSMYCDCENKNKILVESNSICEINYLGDKTWRNSKGERHRLDGPAIEYVNGDKEWWQNGKFHRLNGPAIEYVNGTKYWYQNGKLHRLNGPAIEYANGDKGWFRNDKLHRLDGPAIMWSYGTQWFIEGKELTREEFNDRRKSAKLV